MSAEDALLAYSKRRSKMPRSKKNSRPEKQVEAEVRQWLKSTGFSCHVIESKAVYSEKAGRYLKSQAEAGFSDIVGCDPLGRAVFIELKAPGKARNVSTAQAHFLDAKAALGAFAVVVDSTARLEELYRAWARFMVRGERRMAKVLVSQTFEFALER